MVKAEKRSALSLLTHRIGNIFYTVKRYLSIHLQFNYKLIFTCRRCVFTYTKQQQRSTGKTDSNNINNNSNNISGTEKSVQRIFMRVCLCSFFLVASDLMLQAAYPAFTSVVGWFEYLVACTFIVRTTVILCLFNDYKERLFPFCAAKW